MGQSKTYKQIIDHINGQVSGRIQGTSSNLDLILRGSNPPENSLLKHLSGVQMHSTPPEGK